MPATPRFASLDDAKEYVGVQSLTSENMLSLAVAAAEDMVEHYCRRIFAPYPALVGTADTAAATTKTFTSRGRKVVRIKDLRSATSVSLYGRTLNPNQYDLTQADGKPGTQITLSFSFRPFTDPANASNFAYVVPLLGYPVNDLVITGRWGWVPIPASVYDAVYIIAARKYRLRDAAYSDTAMTPDGTQLAYFNSLPADVKGELDQLRVPNFSVI